MTCLRPYAVAARIVLSVLLTLALDGGCCRAFADTVPKPCDAVPMPLPIRQYVADKYRLWKIVDLFELSDRDRQLWIQGEGIKCPGIAIGHFQSVDRLSYAVLLTRRQGSQDFVMLLAMTEAEGQVTGIIVEKPMEMGPKRHVIFKGPPGRYREAEGPRVVETKFEVIVHKFLEAGTVVYVWTGKRFLEVIVSD